MCLEGLASLIHENAKEPWELPFSFQYDEPQVKLLELLRNQMKEMIQFPVKKPSAFLSFHEPSEYIR
jgi:hypothetical protein